MSVYAGPEIINDGLILCLDAGNTKSYSGTGDTWNDLSGNGYNATRTNNAGYGGQVTFDSSGFFDFSVNSPASSAGATAGNGFTVPHTLIPTSGNFSLISFVRRNTSVKAFGDRETIFSQTGNAEGWRFGMSGNAIYYLIGGSGGVGYQEGGLGGTNLSNGNWHMMAAVFDRAGVFGSYKVYGYVDGVASGEATITAGAGGNTPFSYGSQLPGVGYNGCCDVFAGQIASVFAYNKALTATEISQNFNALRGRFGI